MKLSDINNLDAKNYGSWPMPVKFVAALLLFIVVLVAGYFMKIKPANDDLDILREKEQELISVFTKKQGKVVLPLGLGETYKLDPLTEAGTGFVREPERAYMRELIEMVNALFEGELTDQDKLVYVNRVLLGKLLESETLMQQAASNSKEQFASSPDLKSEILNALARWRFWGW